MEKISVVVTVKNDDEGVQVLKKDLARQTRKPHEVIIIRAEDYDDCTRAEGRNIGIKKARCNIIAVTDAGCRPHKDWLEQITNPFTSKGPSFQKQIVVAGYYTVLVKTPFQRAITPYLAVPWSQNYLPASRSIAFSKRAWKLVGGYPEEATSAGEDLAFARLLSKHPDITMIQAPDALVDWEPPKTTSEYFRNIRDHTRSNFEARIWPHIFHNLTVLVRWVIFLFIPVLIPFYILWPIFKHAHLASKGPSYIGRSFIGFIGWLPIVQLMTDAAILAGIMSLWDTGEKQ